MSLQGLRQGLYAAVVRVKTRIDRPESADTVLVARRIFSLKGPGFPRPSNFDELIPPVEYIAAGHEMDSLRAAKGVEQQRRQFDHFWLNLFKDERSASDYIRKFYTRVEEANRFFTAEKDGWRTDRGMVYIILGPPAQIERFYDTETWYYDYPGSTSVNQYTFKRKMVISESLTIESYVLQRAAFYEPFWDEMVKRWRSGEAY
jgi:GWxTD domain-containing protein